MEIAHVAELPTQPAGVVGPAVNDTEVTPIEHGNNNHAVSYNAVESFKTPEPELVLQAPVEENRPADVVVAPSHDTEGDTHPVTSDRPSPPHTSRSSEAAEVVTPAGTVEAPLCATDSSPREAVEKEGAAPANEAAQAVLVQESEPQKTEYNCKQNVTQNVEHKIEQGGEYKFEQQDVTTPTPSAPAAGVFQANVVPPTTTEPVPMVDSAPSPGKETEKEKKKSDSFASEEVLSEVQKFLTLQIAENRCSSHAKEIHELVEKHLSEVQQKRYVAPLIDRIVQQFTQEATAKGEEVSVDVQSNICLIEQMFLTLGRRSPLQDMYTAEEEEMLDLLFHSNSSDNLPIDI
ncbi:hypothetical protein PRIC1_009996 [Phytophthora ramorum]